MRSSTLPATAWALIPILLSGRTVQPGAGAPPVPPPGACAASFTPIPVIQGRGRASAQVGKTVTTLGVVVGDFEGPAPALRGFYLQDARGDGDARTSDALFIAHGDADSVRLGEVVRVTGVVGEADAQTQLANVDRLVRCGVGAQVRPVDVTLPVPSDGYLERFEGMLVRFPQVLTVTEHFQLGRFGTIVLSSGGRQRQPTDVHAPGPKAIALMARHARNRLLLDDASNAHNPDPIVFGRARAALSAANTLRSGDVVHGLLGVMTQTWGGSAASPVSYRLRPPSPASTDLPVFVAANPRRVAPDAVAGTLRVSALNVLNYFNSFGAGACTAGDGALPVDCRGASSAEEFERQAAKIVSAIRALDPHILGLMEIENDGYGPASAIADLARRLNATAGRDSFAYIDADARTGTRNALGTDAIKVGLLYRPAHVSPVGRTASLNTPAFVTGGDSLPRNRPTLLQAFAQPDGEQLVVGVNHLKSKSGACDAPDARDGQGACNQVRANAARELATWLATDPTGTGDPDLLLLGDLNAYTHEDPLVVLASRGYVDLATTRGPTRDQYTFGFDGLWGSLDHALASRALAAQVRGVTTWHINADEPPVLGYDSRFKSRAQRTILYDPGPFRSSDHDPLLVGVTLSRGRTRRSPGDR
jgi:predicted extracellular nuclease